MIRVAGFGGRGVAHGFFTRRGGVSEGVYAAMNCGFGSGDEPARVAENRRRCVAALDGGNAALVTVHQVHSPTVLPVSEPWEPKAAPVADAMVTARPGLALGILTADCAPVLLVDPDARVIGAAHAGWKGAIGGVLEATVAAMAALGAKPGRIQAAIGPLIGAQSYEVGPEFRDRFVATAADNARFFQPRPGSDRLLFDLEAFVRSRLAQAGVGEVRSTSHDTAAEPDLFFSYRRSCQRAEPDYGRGLSAIMLTA